MEWLHNAENLLKTSASPVLLLEGDAHIGISSLAQTLAYHFLCPQAAQHQGQACGICTSCRHFQQNQHPDYTLIDQKIGIEELQKYTANIHQTPHYQHKKLWVIHLSSIHALGLQTLLKILEDYPPYMRYILVREGATHVPATILSRCVRYQVPAPHAREGMAWLAKNSALDTKMHGIIAQKPLWHSSYREDLYQILLDFFTSPRISAYACIKKIGDKALQYPLEPQLAYICMQWLYALQKQKYQMNAPVAENTDTNMATLLFPSAQEHIAKLAIHLKDAHAWQLWELLQHLYGHPTIALNAKLALFNFLSAYQQIWRYTS